MNQNILKLLFLLKRFSIYHTWKHRQCIIREDGTTYANFHYCKTRPLHPHPPPPQNQNLGGIWMTIVGLYFCLCLMIAYYFPCPLIISFWFSPTCSPCLGLLPDILYAWWCHQLCGSQSFVLSLTVLGVAMDMWVSLGSPLMLYFDKPLQCDQGHIYLVKQSW